MGKRLLTIYGIVYALELFLEHWLKIPVFDNFALHPIASGSFRIWQLFTHLFIHDPGGPIGFLISCLVFYFFAAPVEYALGTRRFVTIYFISALGGALGGLLFSGVSGFGAPYAGMFTSLLSLIVIFGMMNAEATILLMFILPVKAKYISYGTVLVTILTFLAKANPQAAYHLGGILAGYITFRGPRKLFGSGSLSARYQAWRMKKKRSRFTVIDGKRDGDDEGPTYH